MKPRPEDPALAQSAASLPAYLVDTYRWAYLTPRYLDWLDRDWVVSAILWGNARRLMRTAVACFAPGERVFQAACVYGAYLPMLAQGLGPTGRLTVVDAAPLQIDNAARKLAGLPACATVSLRLDDLAHAPQADDVAAYDGVSCFFLLHEVPAAERGAIVAHLLARVRPGGRVVFVDYHRPARWHPLRPLMYWVWRRLEPYAQSLLDADIATLAPTGADFIWRRRTLFGGLYQVVVGERRG